MRTPLVLHYSQHAERLSRETALQTEGRYIISGYLFRYELFLFAVALVRERVEFAGREGGHAGAARVGDGLERVEGQLAQGALDGADVLVGDHRDELELDALGARRHRLDHRELAGVGAEVRVVRDRRVSRRRPDVAIHGGVLDGLLRLRGGGRGHEDALGQQALGDLFARRLERSTRADLADALARVLVGHVRELDVLGTKGEQPRRREDEGGEGGRRGAYGRRRPQAGDPPRGRARAARAGDRPRSSTMRQALRRDERGGDRERRCECSRRQQDPHPARY